MGSFKRAKETIAAAQRELEEKREREAAEFEQKCRERAEAQRGKAE